MGVCTKDSSATMNTGATMSFARDSLYPSTLALTYKAWYIVHVYSGAINGNTHTHHCISTSNHWLCNVITMKVKSVFPISEAHKESKT